MLCPEVDADPEMDRILHESVSILETVVMEARQGSTFDALLAVIDKMPADDLRSALFVAVVLLEDRGKFTTEGV